jgi:DeoR/GlpR family transcriptional regulator of sugar metabolism
MTDEEYSYEKLASMFDCSKKTIRRDIDGLRASGFLRGLEEDRAFVKKLSDKNGGNFLAFAQDLKAKDLVKNDENVKSFMDDVWMEVNRRRP